jgi:hypothetical protein
LRARRHKAQHCARDHAFSRTGFAHQPVYFAGSYAQRDAAQDWVGADDKMKVLDVEQQGHELLRIPRQARDER